MNWINGRPENWKNGWDKQREEDGMFSKAEIFEAGADKMLKALLEWLKQYHTATYHNLDRHNKPAPELEFVIPEKVLKEMEEGK